MSYVLGVLLIVDEGMWEKVKEIGELYIGVRIIRRDGKRMLCEIGTTVLEDDVNFDKVLEEAYRVKLGEVFSKYGKVVGYTITEMIRGGEA